jgi:hypothetical protein
MKLDKIFILAPREGGGEPLVIYWVGRKSGFRHILTKYEQAQLETAQLTLTTKYLGIQRLAVPLPVWVLRLVLYLGLFLVFWSD